jgi:hypothetical protein
MVLWDAGIDWLTMTFEPGHKDYMRAQNMMRAEMTLGTGGDGEIKPVKHRDYIGLERGKIRFAEREDGMIIQASSSPARLIAAKLKEENINGKATRIDFQTTGRTSQDPGDYARKVRTAYEESSRIGQKKSLLNSVAYRSRGIDCGLAIAARSSNRSFRFYNKTLEQRGKVASGLFRFEGEYKGARARQAWNMYKSAANPYWLNCSLMHAEFSAFGIDMSWLAGAEPCEFPSAYEASTDDKSLAWLNSHVRSTVQRLKRAGKLDDVLEALGLDANALT